jgi:hypothetical protein
VLQRYLRDWCGVFKVFCFFAFRTKPEDKRAANMKTSLPLIAAAALALCACESTTPAQRYAQSQQLVAQAYGNKLSPAQQAALATAIYQQAETTRANQQAQSAAIAAQGFQNAGNIIANSARQPSTIYAQPATPLPVYQPSPSPPTPNYQIDTPQYQTFNGASQGQIRY